ncbi:hypothetical protein RFI_16094, partial [Reticulomyxa filosa]
KKNEKEKETMEMLDLTQEHTSENGLSNDQSRKRKKIELIGKNVDQNIENGHKLTNNCRKRKVCTLPPIVEKKRFIKNAKRTKNVQKKIKFAKKLAKGFKKFMDFYLQGKYRLNCITLELSAEIMECNVTFKEKLEKRLNELDWRGSQEPNTDPIRCDYHLSSMPIHQWIRWKWKVHLPNIDLDQLRKQLTSDEQANLNGLTREGLGKLFLPYIHDLGHSLFCLYVCSRFAGVEIISHNVTDDFYENYVIVLIDGTNIHSYFEGNNDKFNAFLACMNMFSPKLNKIHLIIEGVEEILAFYSKIKSKEDIVIPFANKTELENVMLKARFNVKNIYLETLKIGVKSAQQGLNSDENKKCWHTMLVSIPQVSEEAALCIMEKYSSCRQLMDCYKQLSRADGECLLAVETNFYFLVSSLVLMLNKYVCSGMLSKELKRKSKGQKKLGKALSKKIYAIFYSNQDEKILL